MMMKKRFFIIYSMSKGIRFSIPYVIYRMSFVLIIYLDSKSKFVISVLMGLPVVPTKIPLFVNPRSWDPRFGGLDYMCHRC